MTYFTKEWKKKKPTKNNKSNIICGVLSLHAFYMLNCSRLEYFCFVKSEMKQGKKETNKKRVRKQRTTINKRNKCKHITIFLFNSFLKFFASYFGQFHSTRLSNLSVSHTHTHTQKEIFYEIARKCVKMPHIAFEIATATYSQLFNTL